MPATIILDGEDLEDEEGGTHVVIGAVLYNVKEEKLEFLICSELPVEEASAILKRFMMRGKIAK